MPSPHISEVISPFDASGASTPLDASAARRRALVLGLEVAIVVAVALVLRSIGITRELEGDELYHVLAAHNYLRDGTFAIHGGVYHRVAGFTWLVAQMFRFFGEGPVSARLPALVGGVLTVVAAFLFLRWAGSRTGAWAAALLVAFDPDLIRLSQMSRFYTLQHVALILVAAGLFALVAGRVTTRPRQIGVAAGIVLAALLACYLQVLSLIALTGMGIFAVFVGGPPLLARMSPVARRWTIAAAIAVAIAGVLAVMLTPIGRQLHTLATYSDLWGAAQRGNVRFYHWYLGGSYPTFWTLFPLVLLLAFIARPRVALLAVCVFGFSLVLQSLLAWKSQRYLSPAMPFFFILAGLAISRAVPFVRDAFDALMRIFWVEGHGRGARLIRAGWSAGIVLFIFATNSAFMVTVRQLREDPEYLHPGGPTPSLSWRHFAPTLRAEADSVRTVVSTEDLEALYYVGRLDYVLDRDHLYQGGAHPEFTVDRKIGVPMISDTTSIRQLMACEPSGVIIAMRWAMQTAYKVPPATAAMIRSEMREVPLPPESGLVAFRWDSTHAANAPPCRMPARVSPR
ncbi:MAG TPA: hypothetical protein VFK13_08910 [Gemmatimonadaceae bacterium]|nr:hypothetical protein [Gemmatimonadaceae bacterium]